MNYIVAFLLCFNSEENAFNIFSHLVYNVLPRHFFEKTSKGAGLIGFQADKYAFIQ